MRYKFRLLTAWLLVWCVAPVCAQPVLTADNTVLQLLGAEVAVTERDVASPNTLSDQLVRGENVTWDFTVATYADPDEAALRFELPPFDDVPAGGRPEYTDANYAREFVGSISEDIPEEARLHQYGSVDDDRIETFGFAGLVDTDEDGVLDTVAVTYAPADLQIPFPATYGDSWQAFFTQTFHLPDQSFTSGVATVLREIVGWGTLVTPFGSVAALMIYKAFNLTLGEELIQSVESYEFLSPLEIEGNALRSLSASVTLARDGESVEEASVAELLLPLSTAIDSDVEIPGTMSLGPNYPNPFNPATIIPFQLEASAHAIVSVHDVLGRRVAVLADRVFPAGSHTLSFDAASLQSGVYRVSLQSGRDRVSRTITLQK